MGKRLVNAIGVAAVFGGVFSPLFSVPFGSDISYVRLQPGEGVVLAGLAVFSSLCSFANAYWPSFGTSFFIFGHVVVTLFNFYSRLRSLVENHLFAEPIASATSPGFGLGLLLVGAAMLFVSAVIGEKNSEARTCSTLNDRPEGDALWLDKLARLGEDVKTADSYPAVVFNEMTELVKLQRTSDGRVSPEFESA
jgi:hypothetical protein